MLGIIGALDIEIRHILDQMADCQTETISGIQFVKGVLFNTDAVAAVSGACKVNAAVCAQTMLLRYSPEAIINIGIAGGLAEYLIPGDVVVAAALVQHDIDNTGFGDPPGLVPGLGLVDIPCAAHLVSRFSALSQQVSDYRTYIGKIATGDQDVFDREKATRIHRQFDALAIEQEGGSIAQVCTMNGIDFCVIRSISDRAGDGSQKEYFDYKHLAALRPANLVLEYCKQL